MDADRDTNPLVDLVLNRLVLPVADDNAVLLAHSSADETELATTVRALREVHEIHHPWYPTGFRG